MNALHRLDPNLHFDIFTKVPPWFFQDTLNANFTHHTLLSDIGLVQNSSLSQNLDATIAALDKLYPLQEAQMTALTDRLRELSVEAILCDIAPMGLAAADRLERPSFLVENFTWDWIYEGYLEQAPKLAPFIEIHQALNNLARYHIQAVPVCRPNPNSDLTTAPICRRWRQSTEVIRHHLELSTEQPVILVTMGGVQEKYDLMGHFKRFPERTFILPGSTDTLIRDANVIRLPYKSDFYHPDLVNMANVVVGKAGYSTVSEIYHAGVPFGYINRANFQESDIISAFIQMTMPGSEIS